MSKIISQTKKHKILKNGIKIFTNIILYGTEDLAKELVLKCDYDYEISDD